MAGIVRTLITTLDNTLSTALGRTLSRTLCRILLKTLGTTRCRTLRINRGRNSQDLNYDTPLPSLGVQFTQQC